MPAIRARPRSSAAWSASTSQTRNAGIEQRDGDSRAHGARADHGSLLERTNGGGRRDAVHLGRTARSAKKACLSPFDSGVSISSRKARRSMASPSSNGLPAASIASTARMGAGSSGRSVSSLARAASHSAASFGSLSGMSRVLRGGLVATSAEAASSTAAASRIAVHHPIEQGGVCQRRRRHRLALHDHVDRRLDADQPRAAAACHPRRAGARA